MAPVIKKFSSVQNRILIDYKGFRDWVKIEVSKVQNSKSTGDEISMKKSKLQQKIENLEKQVSSIKENEMRI